jgi:hypothetical protein
VANPASNDDGSADNLPTPADAEAGPLPGASNSAAAVDHPPDNVPAAANEAEPGPPAGVPGPPNNVPAAANEAQPGPPAGVPGPPDNVPAEATAVPGPPEDVSGPPDGVPDQAADGR